MTGLVFRTAAAGDVEDAYRWYEEQRPGLGGEFLADVDRALEGIRAHPEQHAVIHRGARRALLRRFPFGLFYRQVDDRVVVVACMHASRDPNRWRVRR